MSNEVLDRVRPLLPAIADRAVEADRQRRVPAETIAELKEAGAFRLLQPKRYGGYESDPRNSTRWYAPSPAPARPPAG